MLRLTTDQPPTGQKTFSNTLSGDETAPLRLLFRQINLALDGKYSEDEFGVALEMALDAFNNDPPLHEPPLHKYWIPRKVAAESKEIMDIIRANPDKYELNKGPSGELG